MSEKFTITITGPRASGKTRWANVLRDLDLKLRDLPKAIIVDEEVPTIENQPEFDCVGKAQAEGQPKPFSLIASDPIAPWLVDVWVAMSRGDIAGALGAFYGMVDTCSMRYAAEPRSDAKLESAETIAMDMRNWRIAKGLR